jgi:hypothetical protein
MTESELYQCKIQSIFINLRAKSVMIEGDSNFLLFNLTPSGITYGIVDIPPPDAPPGMLEYLRAGEEAAIKKSLTLTFTGKVKGDVRQGRPDAKGNPTAWARLAVHQDREDQAKVLSTTFHRAAADIALTLKQEDQITAQGYLRPSDDPTKMDRFSVFHVIDYPSKPKAQEANS